MRKFLWIISILVLMGLFGVPRAHADDITVISITNLTFVGNGPDKCGPSHSSTCTLSVSANLEWDSTTGSIVGSPASSSTTNTGFGTYALCDIPSCHYFDPGGDFDSISLEWLDPVGDYAQVQILYAKPDLTPSSAEIGGVFTDCVPHGGPNDCGFVFEGAVGATSLSAIEVGPCFVDGNPNDPCLPPSSGSGPGMGTSPTPEPASSGLLVVGLGLALVVARMRNSPAAQASVAGG